MPKDIILFTLSVICHSVISDDLDDCERGIFNNKLLNNGVCKACPKGLFGANCTGACPYGRHGWECKSRCNCPDDQFCHLVFGCGYLTVDGFFNQTDEGCQSVQQEVKTKIWGFNIEQWFIISMSLLGGILLVMIFSCCVCIGQNVCKKQEYQPKQILDILATIAGNGTLPRHQQEEENRNQYALQDFSHENEYQPDPQNLNRFSTEPSTSFDVAESAYAEADLTIGKQKLQPMLSVTSTASALEREHYDSMERPPENCVEGGYDRCGLRNNVELPVRSNTGKRGLNMDPLKKLGNRMSRFMTERYDHFMKDFGRSKPQDSFPDPPSADAIAALQQDNATMDKNDYFILEASAHASTNFPGQSQDYRDRKQDGQSFCAQTEYRDNEEYDGESESDGFIRRNKFSSFKGKSLKK